MRTLELSELTNRGVNGRGRIGPLKFGDELSLDPASDDGNDSESIEESLPGGSVLAAAARIESLRSTPSQPSMSALNRQYSS